jgi:glucose uptake protein
MILTMLCWGSWANTLKLCPGYRFQLFYWDYALGLPSAAIFWGLTAGSHSAHLGRLPRRRRPNPLHAILFALGGVIFNIANLLLVAAIDVAGLAVAFPVGIGLALIVGAVSSYSSPRRQSPAALRRSRPGHRRHRARRRRLSQAREANAKAATTRGIVLSLVAGLLMGGFYPLATRTPCAARTGVAPPGPYAIAFFFASACCSPPFPPTCC